jgi:hypothetical protein
LFMSVNFLVLAMWGKFVWEGNEVCCRLWSLNIEWSIGVLKKWITIVWEMLTHLLFFVVSHLLEIEVLIKR